MTAEAYLEEIRRLLFGLFEIALELGQFGLSVLSAVWPFVATLTGAFFGVYLNSIIDAEKEREEEILKPLLRETASIRENENRITPDLVTEDGEVVSKAFEIDDIELHKLQDILRDEIISYRRLIEELRELYARYISVSKTLVEVGYDEVFRNELSSEILAEESVDTNVGGFPGPEIITGEKIVEQGEQGIGTKEVNFQTYVTLPLFPFLMDNIEILKNVRSEQGIREMFSHAEEVDIGFMDSVDESWDEEIWRAINKPFNASEEYEGELPDGKGYEMIEGEGFVDVCEWANSSVDARAMWKRNEIMEQVSRLSMYIYVRVNYPVYHPKRILMAKSDHSTEVFEEDMPLKDDEE
jgi:hypothetical protein